MSNFIHTVFHRVLYVSLRLPPIALEFLGRSFSLKLVRPKGFANCLFDCSCGFVRRTGCFIATSAQERILQDRMALRLEAADALRSIHRARQQT